VNKKSFSGLVRLLEQFRCKVLTIITYHTSHPEVSRLPTLIVAFNRFSRNMSLLAKQITFAIQHRWLLRLLKWSHTKYLKLNIRKYILLLNNESYILMFYYWLVCSNGTNDVYLYLSYYESVEAYILGIEKEHIDVSDVGEYRCQEVNSSLGGSVNVSITDLCKLFQLA